MSTDRCCSVAMSNRIESPEMAMYRQDVQLAYYDMTSSVYPNLDASTAALVQLYKSKQLTTDTIEEIADRISVLPEVVKMILARSKNWYCSYTVPGHRKEIPNEVFCRRDVKLAYYKMTSSVHPNIDASTAALVRLYTTNQLSTDTIEEIANEAAFIPEVVTRTLPFCSTWHCMCREELNSTMED